MSKMIMLRQSSPLFRGSHHGGSRKAGTRLGEAVGGMAAVCCCCPCGLANIMYLAMYKLPASLCRRALQKQKKKQRRRQRLPNKEDLYMAKRRCSCGCGDEFGARVQPGGGKEEVRKVKGEDLEEEEEEEGEDKDLMQLEKEMWERFYSTGFWRSCSQNQRDDSSSTFSSPSSQRIISIVSVSNLQVVGDRSIL